MGVILWEKDSEEMVFRFSREGIVLVEEKNGFLLIKEVAG